MSSIAVRTRGCHCFDPLADLPIVAVFGDKNFNVSFSEEGNGRALKKREEFCAGVGIKLDDVVCPEQIHSANIVRVNDSFRGRGARERSSAVPRTDALITNSKGVALAIQTADCASVFLYDRKREAIGMAHIGWKGLATGLAGKVIDAMKNNFLSKGEDIIVALGPMIRSCCYDVGDERATAFKDFVEKRGKKTYLSLDKGIISQVKESGIRPENIYDCKICTSCRNTEFFSYREEGDKAGRQISILMMK